MPEAHLQRGREQPVAPEQVHARLPPVRVKCKVWTCVSWGKFVLLKCLGLMMELRICTLEEENYGAVLVLSGVGCFLTPY